ncbi:MAG TPA: CaiB/BaiF CoA-transferase family protein [Dermatophilaceae bacterium]|nr:CaiB/BaiF CoA-transferase family protein [Dermatophilaceae bacterium]
MEGPAGLGRAEPPPEPAGGPLAGTRVVEFAGIGPAPFACLLLAELGADVVRVDRPAAPGLAGLPHDVLARSRPAVAVDLKSAAGLALARALVDRADVLVEGLRPGVMERLGLGPDPCLATNPRLVYGRMTGWGQDGPLAERAGHDITYAAVSGALHACGTADKPIPPVNVLADFGGGSLYLVAGVLAALLARATTGRGQVVDAAMVDGSASLLTMVHGLVGAGHWADRRQVNLLDGGAPFYDTYRCADGRWVAVGALEPQFYAELLDRLGVAHDAPQLDVAAWPRLRETLTAAFAARTRDEWAEHFAGSDACVAPVLSLTEAPDHPHLRARGTFTELDGVVQPRVAPRFSATPGREPTAAAPPGPEGEALVRRWGLPEDLVSAAVLPGAAPTHATPGDPPHV